MTIDVPCGRGTMIDRRNGGPYDRGGADSYYRRGFDPHYFLGNTGQSLRIGVEGMTARQIAEYRMGFLDNEDDGNFKEWE
jgi:hypothetical protein